MKKILCFVLLSTLLLSGSIFYNLKSRDALSRIGSTGSEVTKIQTKLKNWGYYKGAVDGKYGSATQKAVKEFQRKNNLTPDGIAGSATLKAMGISSSSSSSASNNDVYLLARAINGEARGEPYSGQVAVGAVILNRVKHPSFPNTVAGVVYQPGAFTAVDDGQIDAAMTSSCERAARDALNGWDPTGGAIYYYNPVTATNKWIRSRPIILTIGKHVFCS
ncbi:MAG: spore cortex-lytic enzyme [Clostridia bacterium]|nr:spore cortex-lytic enzyme [Clostridia bacterium]